MSKSSTIEQMQKSYKAEFEEMRNRQSDFEIKRAKLREARERRNRFQQQAKANEDAAEKAIEAVRNALDASDGEVTPEVQAARRDLRDARDMAEDFKALVLKSERELAAVEVPVIHAAREMDKSRRAAVTILAELELAKFMQEAGPKLARILTLFSIAYAPMPGHNLSPFELREPVEDIANGIKRFLINAPHDVTGVPEDLLSTGDIAPLRWKDVSSPIYALQSEHRAGLRSIAPGTDTHAYRTHAAA